MENKLLREDLSEEVIFEHLSEGCEGTSLVKISGQMCHADERTGIKVMGREWTWSVLQDQKRDQEDGTNEKEKQAMASTVWFCKAFQEYGL